jgi:peptidyl-prolyl cis-trans isomerase SurA
MFSNISFSDIKIISTINNKIITNYDSIKESEYLKILNPNLEKLDEERLMLISKESLEQEIIKKQELSNFIDLNVIIPAIDEYIDTLSFELGYKNLSELIEALSQKKSYTIDELRLKLNIEFYWNDLIKNKYKNQIVINKSIIASQLDIIQNKTVKEFLLSEIVFKKEKDIKIEDTISKIKKSINEIGFENSANLYSISKTSKFGGKVGWIKVDSLLPIIYKNIINLKENEQSEIININDDYFILQVNEIRELKNNNLNTKNLENELIEIEKNKKLEKYSRIYFNKIKKNYVINEK